MVDDKYSLLIADDEENILNSMERYIRSHSECFRRIYCAHDGQETLDMIVKHHPDIMLLDVKMPVKSGLEVMREALEMELCPKTIILSGYDTFAYAQQALRMGAVDYLLKPASSKQILDILEKTLGAVSGEIHSDKTPDINPLIGRAIEYMKAHMSEDINLIRVAEEVSLSPAYFSSLFMQNVGMGFIDYLNKIRIEAACGYMHDERKKVYEIAFLVGFHDEKYFSRVFRKITGKTPSEYKKEI